MWRGFDWEYTIVINFSWKKVNKWNRNFIRPTFMVFHVSKYWTDLQQYLVSFPTRNSKIVLLYIHFVKNISSAVIFTAQEENNLFVGKTEYSLTIVDSKTARQTWNVTYVSYAAPLLNDHVEYRRYLVTSLPAVPLFSLHILTHFLKHYYHQT